MLGQGRDMYGVSHSATVTICVVGSEIRRRRAREGQVRDRRDLGRLVFRWYLLPVNIIDI
jgi:hypothetical protein